MNESKNGVSWLHRCGSLVAVMAFLLYITGTLVSESGTGLFAPHWAGLGAGIQPPVNPPGKYVHLYQFFAVATAILTVAFVLWLWRTKSHRYLKTLGGITIGVLVIIALMVLSPLSGRVPNAVSFWYTFGIQVFFCLTVCLALFTRTDWRWDEFKTPDLASPSIRQILVFMTIGVFVQMLLDVGLTKKVTGMGPHLVLGIAATVCSLWVLEMALTKFSHLRAFKISSVFLAEVVVLQLFLGIINYSMKLNARVAAGPQPGLVVMSVTTAAVGALVLATSLFVTCQAFKYFASGSVELDSDMIHRHQ